METLETLSNNVFIEIIDPQQRIATNLNKRFPVTSNWGNKYLFVLYEYDSNNILLSPMKNRTEK